MVWYSLSMPVPFKGGNISNEKAVFSLLCIRSITLISFSLSLSNWQKSCTLGTKIRKRNEICRKWWLFFYTADGKTFIIIISRCYRLIFNHFIVLTYKKDSLFRNFTVFFIQAPKSSHFVYIGVIILIPHS